MRSFNQSFTIVIKSFLHMQHMNITAFKESVICKHKCWSMHKNIYAQRPQCIHYIVLTS